MVDEKMTQCADSIDTQFNVLFAVWVKSVKGWYESEVKPWSRSYRPLKARVHPVDVPIQLV